MIYRVNSFFRTHAITIGLIIIALAFAAILSLQTIATSKLQTELETQQQIVSQTQAILRTLSTNAATRTQQIDSLNKHIDCLALFFAQPDRTTKSISNIETCTVVTSNGKTSVIFQPPLTPTATPTSSPAATPAPATAPVKQTAPAATPAPNPTPVPVAPALLSPVFDTTKKLLNLP